MAAAETLVASCLAGLQELTAESAPTAARGGGERRAGSTLPVVMRRLEELKCAAAAAQAALAVRLDAEVRSTEAAQGIPAARRGRGVASEVGLARRVSPYRGRRLLGLAKILAAELPCTWQAFRAGRITEAAATLIAQETACLTVEHRLAVDRLVAGDPEALEERSEKEIRRAAAAAAARLDPASVVERRARAAAGRRVTVVPAPDGMSRLTITVPLARAWPPSRP